MTKAALGRVCEEEDGAGDVVGTGEAGHGDTTGDVVVGIAAAGLVRDIHLCFDPAGTDGVDANATPAPLSGKGAGEPYEAVLGGVIGGTVADTHETGDGSHVGDTAVSLREHDGPEGPRENKGCDEVHLKHAAEGRGFGGLGRSDEADPCVVDEDVGKAPTSRYEGDGLRDQSLVGDVTDERFCFRASRTQCGEPGFAGLHIEQHRV